MSIANAIRFRFHGPVQEMINQNPVAGYSSQQIHYGLLQLFVVDHNAHSLPTKHITGSHQDGIPHIVRDLQGFLSGFSHPVPWIWNIKFFDFPYLVNRINKILGEKEVVRLSPWGRVSDRTVTIMGRANIAYEMLGIATLDYIEMYRKFAPGGVSQESYKLNNIANVEIGEKKISYEEYDNLHTLYRENYQKFIEYNITDVELVVAMDTKLQFIELSRAICHSGFTPYEDYIFSSKYLEGACLAYLKKKGLVASNKPKDRKERMQALRDNNEEKFIGAYVKEPIENG